jgi:hypothetical protein
MSFVAWVLRRVRGLYFSPRKSISGALLAALPIVVLTMGPSHGAERTSDWRYWRSGGVERPYYPAENRPFDYVPPMPVRKYDVYDHHTSGPNPVIEYESEPRPVKRKIHKYSEHSHEERHDGYDDHADADDENDESPDHHANGYGFGRLFPGATERSEASERKPALRALRKLGLSMVEEGPGEHPSGNSEQPAGYTFFGQFIDHDITFETVTDLGREISSDSILHNARTPDLDLDNVYGGGPKRTPHLYRLPYIRVGHLISEEGELPRYDLFRTKSSYSDGPAGGRAIALLGDPRNDENVIISQLHAAFVAFHNRTVDILVEREFGEERAEYCEDAFDCTTQELATSLPLQAQNEIFEQARDHVIHFYHRLILEDFLPRLIGPKHTANLLKRKRDFYFPDGFRDGEDKLADAYIPIEFSFAFRYGHSQVRDRYMLRDGVEFELLSDGRDGSPRAFEPVRPRHLVDWRYFFEIDSEIPYGFNFARKIDPELAKGLHQLHFSNAVGTDEINSLAVRNLMRARNLHVPSGTLLARIILPKLEKRGLFGRSESTRSDHGGDIWRAFLLRPDERGEYFLGEADVPLWYYVLQEASAFGMRTNQHARPPQGGRGQRRYSADESDRDRDGFRPASFSYEEEEEHGEYSGSGGGHRLGPVGAAIVGEVLTGLIEHFAVKTSKGIEYRPQIAGGLSILKHDGKARKRYLMRNFLIDSGVVGKGH